MGKSWCGEAGSSPSPPPPPPASQLGSDPPALRPPRAQGLARCASPAPGTVRPWLRVAVARICAPESSVTAKVGRNDPVPPEGHLGRLGSRRVCSSGTGHNGRGGEGGGRAEEGEGRKAALGKWAPCRRGSFRCSCHGSAFAVTCWERLASEASQPWASPAPLGTRLPAPWSMHLSGSPCARRFQLGWQVRGHPTCTGPGTTAQWSTPSVRNSEPTCTICTRITHQEAMLLRFYFNQFTP